MYDDADVARAVNQFLLQDIEVQRRSGQARDVESLQRQVFDLVSTAFLIDPSAFFYLVYLARNRVLARVREQIDRVTYIVQVGDGLGRPSKKVESTVELSNAEAALLTLNAGLNTRSQGVRGEIGPTVDRFSRSVQAFARDELVKNVMVGSTVTPTAAELQANVRLLWRNAAAQQARIDAGVTSFIEALARFDAAQLPARTLSSITGRVYDRLVEVHEEMDGADAVAKSRLAMLDLITMQSVLARAADFRAPRLQKAPPRGTAPATLLDSGGVGATVTGSVSAPFFATQGVDFELTVDGDPLVASILRDTYAELVTTPMVFPGAAGIIEVAVDLGSSINSVTLDLSLIADGPALTVVLATGLTDCAVSWDALNDVVRIRNENIAPGSLQLLTDTDARLASVFELFRSSALYAVPSPIFVPEALFMLASYFPTVDISSVGGVAFSGEALSTGLELQAWKYSSTSWTVEAPNVFIVEDSPSSAGLRAGDTLFFTDGLVKVSALVQQVAGRRITTQNPLDVTGMTEMRGGTDLSLLTPGAIVEVVGGLNAGFFMVDSAGLGSAVLQSPIPHPGIVSIVVHDEYLRFQTQSTTTSSSLVVGPGSSGNVALGVQDVEALASLSIIQVTQDLLAAGVRAGDIVVLTDPDGNETSHTVTLVTARRVSFAPAVLYAPGSWQYRILNAKYARYDASRAAVSDALSTAGDFAAADRAVRRILQGAQYRADVQSGVSAYLNGLEAIHGALLTYEAPKDFGVHFALATLSEHGMERALDHLLDLRLADFFAMVPDDTSYDTHLMRKAADAARQITPVHRYAKSQFVGQTHRVRGRVVEPFSDEDPPDEA